MSDLNFGVYRSILNNINTLKEELMKLEKNLESLPQTQVTDINYDDGLKVSLYDRKTKTTTIKTLNLTNTNTNTDNSNNNGAVEDAAEAINKILKNN